MCVCEGGKGRPWLGHGWDVACNQLSGQQPHAWAVLRQCFPCSARAASALRNLCCKVNHHMAPCFSPPNLLSSSTRPCCRRSGPHGPACCRPAAVGTMLRSQTFQSLPTTAWWLPPAWTAPYACGSWRCAGLMACCRPAAGRGVLRFVREQSGLCVSWLGTIERSCRGHGRPAMFKLKVYVGRGAWLPATLAKSAF